MTLDPAKAQVSAVGGVSQPSNFGLVQVSDIRCFFGQDYGDPVIPKSSAEVKDLRSELKAVHALRAEPALGFA